MTTTSVKIQGHLITVPAPYSAGHVLSEAEANFLSHKIVAYAGQPAAGQAKALGRAVTAEEVKEIVEERLADLRLENFGKDYSGEGKTGNKLQETVRMLLRSAIRAKLAAEGISARAKGLTEEEIVAINARIEMAVTKNLNNPDVVARFTKEAQERLDKQSKRTDSIEI